jgi:pimeloyl-ACP methyl ester carboxylesterase
MPVGERSRLLKAPPNTIMKNAITILTLCAAALAPCKTSAAPEIPAGPSSFELEAAGKTVIVFTHRPAVDVRCLFIVLHGMNRNAEDYRNFATPMAERFGALVAAPRFDLEQFPVEAYQRGGVTRDGEVRPVEDWTFSWIPRVAAEMRARAGQPYLPVYLIGHSAGGQFLNRLSAFLPGEAVRIVSANPGTLIFPARDQPFQFGFGGLPESLGGDEALRRYLAAPLTLVLGLEDTGDKNLDKSPAAMLQGEHRLERGRAAFEAGKRLADERGWEFAWRKVELPGVGHDSRAVFNHPLMVEAFGLEEVAAPRRGE